MHWRNSNFQYAYFIFGACHTPIEAHRKCCEAIEGREMALCEAAESPIVSADAKGRNYQRLVEQAKAELTFLMNCKARLEELIGRVPEMADYQSNQREEWRLELENRAENLLLCTGSISPDHFATMRQHPDFDLIMKKIDAVKIAMQKGEPLMFHLPAWRKAVDLLENK